MSDMVIAAAVAALGVALALAPPSMARLAPAGKFARRGWLVGRGRGPEPPGLRTQLPDALGLMAVCLDAGLPLVAAIRVVAQVSPPATAQLLSEVGAQLTLGRAGADAWRELRDHQVWGRVATDIARAERSGAALSEVLRVHAEDARQEARDEALKVARTLGVRSVLPLMVCFLPAFMLIGVVPIVAGLIGNFFRGG